MAKPITIEIVGDDKKFRATMNSVDEGVGSMTAGIGRAAAVVGGALAAAGIAEFGADALGMASDMTEAAGAAESIFAESFGQVEQALANSATAMGVNRAEALDLANGLGVLFQETTDAERATIALDLAARSADVGSMFNDDPQAVAEAFTSALNGSSETVRKYGIDTSDAAIKQYALENGIEGVGGQLSEAEKKMIRKHVVLLSLVGVGCLRPPNPTNSADAGGVNERTREG